MHTSGTLPFYYLCVITIRTHAQDAAELIPAYIEETGSPPRPADLQLAVVPTVQGDKYVINAN